LDWLRSKEIWKQRHKKGVEIDFPMIPERRTTKKHLKKNYGRVEHHDTEVGRSRDKAVNFG